MSADKFRLEWQRMSKLKQLLMIATANVKLCGDQHVMRIPLSELDGLTTGDTLLMSIVGDDLVLQVLNPGAEMLVLDVAAAPAQRHSSLPTEGETSWQGAENHPTPMTRSVYLDDNELARREQTMAAQTHRNQVDSSKPPHQRARLARQQAMDQAEHRMPPDKPAPLT